MDQNDEMEVYNSATTSFDLVESVSKMQSLYVNKEFAALGDKTWIEEANIQIQDLTVAIEQMKKQTCEALKQHIEAELEIKDIAQLKEQIRKSSDLARKSCIHLDEQIRNYQTKVEEWQQRYSSTLSDANGKYECLKRRATEDNHLYQQLEKLKIEEMKVNVDLKYKLMLIKQKGNIRKKKNEILKKIFYADCVQIAEYKSNEKMLEQINEMEKLEKDLKLQFHNKKLDKAAIERKANDEGYMSSSSSIQDFRLQDFEEVDTFASIQSKVCSEAIDVCINTQFTFKIPTPSLSQKLNNDSSFRTQIKRSNSKVHILNVEKIHPKKSLNRTTSLNLSHSSQKSKRLTSKRPIMSSGIEAPNKIQRINSVEAVAVASTTAITQTASVTVSQTIANQPSHANDKVADFEEMSFTQPNTKENEDFFNVSADIGNEGLIDTNSSVGFRMSPPASNHGNVDFFGTTNPSDQFFNIF